MDNKVLAAVEIISQFYGTLSDETKLALDKKMKIVTFKKDHTLLKAGQQMDKVYFILNGSAREYYIIDKDKEVNSWFSFEYEFVTNTPSFFMGGPSKYYLKTMEESEFLEIPKQHVLDMSLQFHDFERLKGNIVTKIMLELHERNYSLMRFRTAKEKYDNFLQMCPNAERIALSHVASFLGITLETLSRIRNPRYGK